MSLTKLFTYLRSRVKTRPKVRIDLRITRTDKLSSDVLKQIVYYDTHIYIRTTNTVKVMTMGGTIINETYIDDLVSMLF